MGHRLQMHRMCHTPYLHDQLSAFGEGLFGLLSRDVLDGTFQLLLDLLVGSLVQHLLEGAEGHCD